MCVACRFRLVDLNVGVLRFNIYSVGKPENKRYLSKIYFAYGEEIVSYRSEYDFPQWRQYTYISFCNFSRMFLLF